MYYGLLPEIKLSYLILSYASNHGGLVIYLNDSWNYKLKSCQTDSQIWEKKLLRYSTPIISQRKPS